MRILSFRGIDFAAAGLDVAPVAQIAAVELAGSYVGGRPLRFAGTTPATRVIPAEVTFAPSDWEGQRDALLRILGFDRDADAEAELVLERDDGARVVVQARPRTLAPLDDFGLGYTVAWEAADWEWQAAGATTSAVTGPSVADTPVTLSVTPSGTARTRPVVTVTPLKAKVAGASGVYAATWTVSSAAAVTSLPVTLPAWDHAAEVTAGHSLAAATDVRAFVDGSEVRRGITPTTANTSTCQVTVPITLAAGGSATVRLTWAPVGETYGLGGYCHAGLAFSATERTGTALSGVPVLLDLNHHQFENPTPARSQASGADIRVWVDGAEVARGLAAAGDAGGHTKVWFALSCGANAVVRVAVGFSASGYDCPLGAYAPAMDLATSTQAAWKFGMGALPDPAGSTTPGSFGALSDRYGGDTNPNKTDASHTAVSGDDAITVQNDKLTGGNNGGGNVLRWYAGGIPIASLGLRVPDCSGGSTLRAGSALTTYESVVQTLAISAYATYTFPAGKVSAWVGVPCIGVSLNRAITVAESGASPVTLTLDSSKTPLVAAVSAPSVGAGTTSYAWLVSGTLTAGAYTLVVAGLPLAPERTLRIDADARTIQLLDSGGSPIAASAAAARAALALSGPDDEWLALEPGETTTLTWDEDGVDASGMTLTVAVRARWR